MKLKAPFMDSSGVTLIELLTALTLTIMVLGVFFNALQNSMNAYDKTAIHNRLRQEANIVLTSLAETHRKWDLPYKLASADSEITLNGDSGERTISSGEFKYLVTINEVSNLNDGPVVINASSYHISLTVRSKRKAAESYTLSTSIDRIKED
ncbi:type II secretion system protein [Bacillus marinisedimentorum]|uniref:type II secretion system protein n=1 Tax=Bacillus marinisedimentorum TaxID=1821260 RepID=UPI000871B4DC|nr:hypothetical protein [Bacillus marinisedimentorum]